jgi:hypothetical protein
VCAIGSKAYIQIPLSKQFIELPRPNVFLQHLQIEFDMSPTAFAYQMSIENANAKIYCQM